MPFPVLMLIDFLPILLFLAVILLIGGWLLGWRVTYDVLTLDTSPYDQDVANRGAGWLLFLTGWLAVPSIIGALAGEAVGHAMERRTTGGTLKKAAEKLRAELGVTQQPPQQPPTQTPQHPAGPGSTPEAGP
ncbi:hypothetical protein GCM10010294_21480 [Streptomyces griseoloalbus]|nr:hypothetical protein GCM10010294_21480 [Streptomyces griseoloalbus]